MDGLVGLSQPRFFLTFNPRHPASLDVSHYLLSVVAKGSALLDTCGALERVARVGFPSIKVDRVGDALTICEGAQGRRLDLIKACFRAEIAALIPGSTNLREFGGAKAL